MNENGVDTTTVEETSGTIDAMGVDVSEYMTGGGEDHPEQPETVADTPADTPASEAPAEETPAEEQQATGSDGASDGVKIPVKCMGQERELTVAEATEYAQKGMDYDRVKEQLHSANTELEQLRKFQADHAEDIEFLQKLADESHMSLSAMIDEIRASQLMKRENISRDLALERIKREKAERQLDSRNRERQQQDTDAAKRQADIAAFLQKFPGVSSSDIPREVWEQVRGGETLVHAYEAHTAAKAAQEKDQRIAELERQLAAEKQNSANRQRSTGSQRTGGQEAPKDQFMEYFLSDD